jgi:hypothetical protein
MTGQRPVTLQTAWLIAYLERDCDALSGEREVFCSGRVGKPRLPWMHRNAEIAARVPPWWRR